jgi:hypothetical protein
VQAVSGGGGLAARGGAELAEDAGHVPAGGLGRDEQLGRDLAVAAPGRDQPQDLQFACGQPGRRGPGGPAGTTDLDARPPRQLADLLQQRMGAELPGEVSRSLQPDSRRVLVPGRCRGARGGTWCGPR